ncbi:MAG: hypothetical protein RIS75_705 [Actinomycetota bacterium]|jgi:hypothetical protein
MSRKITRARAIQSGILQMVGGFLIVIGTFAARSDGFTGWQGWVGFAVASYFLIVGAWRTRAAFALPADK